MATGIRNKVAIVGMGCTEFGEHWRKGPEDLMVEAFEEALGDAGLEQEVLAMFSAQAAELVNALAAMPSDAGALAHTLKGSARAIGAFAVADAAARLEAVMGSGSDPSDSLAELGDAVSLARASIEALLRRS